VVAGPGTGKTFMLASRIANILASTDVRSDNILCLTFTEAGVTAMRQKLHNMIGDSAYYVKVATYHGFANEVIQANPDKFSFSKDLEQLDDLGAFKLMREIIIEELASEGSYDLIPFHNKYQYQGEISKNIQTLKREAVLPERLKVVSEEIVSALEADPKINGRTKKPTDAWQREMKSAKRNIELARIYARYQEKLKDLGKYDYEDMIMSVIERLGSDDELLAYYQEKYLYILVDEYQDTNGSQNQIIKHLGSFDERPNIFAVGDDDQAIYRFQGANVENLLFFEKQFKDVTTIPVTINYRSSQLVLDAAESVIEHNENRLTKLIPNLVKHLVAGNDIPEHKIQVFKLSSYEAEINCIVKR
jgi:DNA helicase-2/ATP-dependent DNA helicase PcrA